MSTFHLTNSLLLSRHHIPTDSVAPFFVYNPNPKLTHTQPKIPPIAPAKG